MRFIDFSEQMHLVLSCVEDRDAFSSAYRASPKSIVIECIGYLILVASQVPLGRRWVFPGDLLLFTWSSNVGQPLFMKPG